MRITLNWWLVPIALLLISAWCGIAARRNWDDLLYPYLGMFFAACAFMFTAGMCAAGAA